MIARIKKNKYVAEVKLFAENVNEVIPVNLWNYILDNSDSSCGDKESRTELVANIPTNYFDKDAYKLDSVISILRAKCSKITINGEELR